jgi:hypothetical protein
MKYFLSILIFIFCYATINAQTNQGSSAKDMAKKIDSNEESRFYIKAYLDYGLASPNAFNGIPIVAPNTTLKPSKTGWGQGLKVGIGGAYIYNDFVNFGLDIDYFLSPKIESSAASSLVQINSVFNGQILAFTPNVTFKAIQSPDFYPYCRVGVTIGVPFGMTNTTNIVATTGSTKTVTQSIYTFKASPAFGYIAALGVRKSLSPGLKLFMELQANNLTIQPQSASLTTYQVNGDDKLATRSVAETEITYKDDANTTVNPNSPTQTESTSFLVARICLQIGFTFRF